MKRVVFNQKGGVGKSSITCNLAAISAAMGHKTLVIDLDVQGNSSMYLGHNIHDADSAAREGDVAQLFKSLFRIAGGRKLTATQCVIETEFKNLSLLPSSLELSSIEMEVATRFKSNQLEKALNELSAHYDRIYIDTPPAFGFYSRSALMAADRVLIPFDCDIFAQQALYNVINNMLEIKAKNNQRLSIEGIIINQFTAQSKLPSELVAELKSFDIPVLDAYLSSSIKMKMSHAEQMPLIYLDRTHNLTQQFVRLYELIEDEYAYGLRKESSVEKIDNMAKYVNELVLDTE